MIEYKRNGNGTGTMTIAFTGDIAKIEPIIEEVAESMYAIPIDGPVFADLSNQEKLDIIHGKVKSVLLAHARNIREVKARDAVQSVDPNDWS